MNRQPGMFDTAGIALTVIGVWVVVGFFCYLAGLTLGMLVKGSF